MLRVFGVALLLWGSSLHAATVADWPQFRGPGGQGHHMAVAELPVQWSETKGVSWKVPVSGLGWSSPVVRDEEVWITTAIDETRSLRALCFDLRTGKVQHDVEVFRPNELVVKHDRNSHATPTPVIGNKRVYVHFGTYGTAALDRATGDIIWKNNDIVLEHQWGPGSSPVLQGKLLIVNCDGMKLRYVSALDTETGEMVWKVERSIPIDKGGHYRKAFSTPLLMKSDDRLVAISTGANQVSAYDVTSGQEQWNTEFNGYAAVSTPVSWGDMIFITTGYGDHSLLAIHGQSKDGHRAGDIAWKANRGAPIIPSPIAVHGSVYFSSDDGILQCLNAKTGSVQWRQRLDGNFASSPTYAGGHLYFHNDKGETFVLKANSKKMQLVSTNKLDGNIQASMAVAGESLIIRTDSHLYRIHQ